MTDTQRIDWLEAFIEEQRTLVLHINANCYGYSGIGLRAGDLNRSLRQAIDSAAGKVPAAAAGSQPRSSQAGATPTQKPKPRKG